MIALDRPRRLLVVGVGGPGMSAIALVLAQMGHQVRGTDLRETPYLDRLRAEGIDVHIGHHIDHLDGIDAVVASTAIRDDNLEIVEATRRSIPVVRRSGILPAICAEARSIGVAGTHGKTTTTSMLALIARDGGLDPSFVIGGQLHDVGSGAHWSGNGPLVIEADESDGTFLSLGVDATILTNIDADHLDHFGTMDELVGEFSNYLAAVSGPIVVSADDERALAVAREVGRTVITYGTSAGADVRIVGVNARGPVQSFSLERDGVVFAEIELPLRGVHMARNATAAMVMALELGVSVDDARRALRRFGGVGRRFEIRAIVDGITLVDDYAHLPAEIDAVLRAAATSGDEWRRVVAVFQPNRFSRMAMLSGDYGDAFTHADVIVLTDIYSSGEVPLPGVTGKLVVNAVLDAHPSARVLYLPRRRDLIDVVARELRAGDVCISMGCGDIANFPDELVAARSARS